MEKFSVLMSLYYKEKPEYFCQCMESILNQTVLPDEIVIVKDGPLTEELEKVLNSYVEKEQDLYKIIPLKENVGLGLALAEGMHHCSNNLVARMDTDDIAVDTRFEEQLNEFSVDKQLDIWGSHILEFEGDTNNIVAKRNVPLTHEDIESYQKKRDAFNHMTVMYKKDMVLKAGNYQSCLLMEDTLLWVNMIMSGAKCKNINKYLVYARVGKDMFERRGGWDYFKKYKSARDRVRQTGYVGFYDHYFVLAMQLVVCLLPNSVRGFIFKKILH